MIEVKAIKRLGNLKEEENLRFRQFLKMNADPDKLDRQFKELHNKYFKIYDCSKCRNCCRELGTVITEDELDAITKTLHIDKEKFKKKYLEEDDDRYKFKTKSCQFLNNNNCKVKKSLPKSCKDYPFTDKEDRLYSMYSIIGNASICPVVYEILEELKKKYNFR